MTFSSAMDRDRAGDVVGAVNLYEESLDSAPLEVLLDLAVLYWRITDYGFWSTRGLPRTLVDVASTRSLEVLEAAQKRFPEASAPAFWRKYTDWADLGEPLSPDDCRRWLAEDPSYLEPAFYLFSVSGGKECDAEASALLERAKARATFRSKYVASVIESVLQRSSA